MAWAAVPSGWLPSSSRHNLWSFQIWNLLATPEATPKEVMPNGRQRQDEAAYSQQRAARAHLAGYGQQVALFAPLLNEHYDVAISAFYGLQGAPIWFRDMQVLPGHGGEFGNDTLPEHAKFFFGGDPKAGIVMTLCDVWPLDPRLGEKLNLCSWVPVDHRPAPPAVFEFLAKSGSVPIAMTRFGERMLGLLDPLYCPHGVDTQTYRPLSRVQCRNGAIPDDAFLVGMVAANKGRPSRKAFPQALEAFAQFAAEHDNAYLYLHTTLDRNYADGVDIPVLLEALGIPDSRVRIADQYSLIHRPPPPREMAMMFGALDVLLAPSFGEGFGIPVLEAAACGVPSIVTDFTAMPEVQGPAGWRVQGHSYWTGLNSWQAIPDIGQIRDALEDCYQLGAGGRAELASQARRHAEGYDARRVLSEFMLPSLRAVEQRFSHREPVRIPSRQVAA